MRTLLHPFLVASLLFVVACSNNKPPAQQQDAGMTDAPAPTDGPNPNMVDASCFTNPTTNIEILNACTNATVIYKNSHPPLTLPDGGLPPLP